MINDLDSLTSEILKDMDSLSYIEIKQKYLSKTGLLTSMFKGIKDISLEKKLEYGKELNKLKKDLEEKIKEKEIDIKDINLERKIDPTAPFDINTPKDKRPHILDLIGSAHPLMQELEKILDIFQRLGFDILESKQIDDDFHMFESLNFPKGHPARDMYDTFWSDEDFVLPAHTSTMLNRALRRFGPPPIRVVLPGRCFRNEATDASHDHSFYQIEGIYVDEGISMGHMQAVIK